MKPIKSQLDAPKSFRIHADKVPVSGLKISEELSDVFVSNLVVETDNKISWKCTDNSQIECDVDHEADMLRLSGRARFKMMHPCVRCMEDVEMPIEINLNARLMPREKDPDFGKEEVEAEAFDDSQSMDDDLAVIYYDHGIVDLSQLLREQLFLELPEYPTCSFVSSRVCDTSVLDSLNASSKNIIEHPFSKLRDWKATIAN